MGGSSSTGGLEKVFRNSSSKIGVSVTGRYHKKDQRKLGDDYETTTKVLGSGYNGQVHLAKRAPKKDDPGDNNCKYAIKGFKLHGVKQEKREELETECEIFLGLDHPHVVRLLDVYESEEQLDLVMECMDGGELFKRVTEKKRFSERDAAEATHQMLLAINYLHDQHIVHRDIKLENFLYENKDYKHLKLIDFGFSKMWHPNQKMALSCGTLSYVAPEVLGRNYTSQCDMWSLGVVVFILLCGYMPFSGTEDKQVAAIRAGRYAYRKDYWTHVSSTGRDFVKKLLVVDPLVRLTPKAALAHPWMEKRKELTNSKPSTEHCQALVAFGQASQFRRLALSMMAWSLTGPEMEIVRQAFLDFDSDNSGSISLKEFRAVLEKNFHMEEQEIATAFQALDVNHDHFIEYSEFLAAMVTSRIKLHDDLLRQTFRRFDTHNTGYISAESLKEILGPCMPAEDVDKLLAEVTNNAKFKNQISYDEFMHYLNEPDSKAHHHDAAVNIIDYQLTVEDNQQKRRQHVTMKPGIANGETKIEVPGQKQAKKEDEHEPLPDKKATCCVVM